MLLYSPLCRNISFQDTYYYHYSYCFCFFICTYYNIQETTEIGTTGKYRTLISLPHIFSLAWEGKAAGIGTEIITPATLFAAGVNVARYFSKHSHKHYCPVFCVFLYYISFSTQNIDKDIHLSLINGDAHPYNKMLSVGCYLLCEC